MQALPHDPSRIRRTTAAAYRVPTAGPEADGTISWDHTTLVVAEVAAADHEGLGYSYADPAAAQLIRATLAPLLEQRSALDIPALHRAMDEQLRNIGRPGIAAMALSAVDNALWDLKGKLLSRSVLDLLGAAREAAPLYGSGGFTSYSVTQLQQQLGGWAEAGFQAVKMKIGRDPAADRERVRAARAAIGDAVELFVDANGAYSRKQALAQAEAFAESGVTWFEEPVSADDCEGLRLVRDRAPAGMRIAAGEYGFVSGYFQRLLSAGAVDVLQADATRCGGITGFLAAAAVTESCHGLFSFHCAPALHAAPACAAGTFLNGEYFFDHARIEAMLFDGVPSAAGGQIAPDRSQPGLGLTFKRQDAERFLVA